MDKKIYNTFSDLCDIPHFENVPLSSLTSFRIGGPADIVFFPETEKQLVRIVSLSKKQNIPFRLLGNGTNTLAPDSGYHGFIICLNRVFSALSVTDTFCRCSAGMLLSTLARETGRLGLAGMEGLEGIPGTVGGACAMNAGAYGYEIKQILHRVRILRGGEIDEIDVCESDLGYRSSAFSFPNAILIEAEFSLSHDDGKAVDRMNDFRARRQEKQPLEYPSAGSVFKRPQGYYAGSLIEQCGLKGYSIGGAMVSEKHAGFIINTGNATESDVKKLIDHIQNIVFKATGVQLERELKYWNEVK